MRGSRASVRSQTQSLSHYSPLIARVLVHQSVPACPAYFHAGPRHLCLENPLVALAANTVIHCEFAFLLQLGASYRAFRYMACGIIARICLDTLLRRMITSASWPSWMSSSFGRPMAAALRRGHHRRRSHERQAGAWRRARLSSTQKSSQRARFCTCTSSAHVAEPCAPLALPRPVCRARWSTCPSTAA